MRYELKHDKLAAQIFNLASTEAKARRTAENIYHLYDEIGATRLFTEEELEYLAHFQSVLRPKDSLLALIETSKQELTRAQREDEERERERLEREKDLVRKVKTRQQRIYWVVGIAGVVALALLAFALIESRRAADNQRLAAEIRQNLERKSLLTQGLKQELTSIISTRRQREPAAGGVDEDSDDKGMRAYEALAEGGESNFAAKLGGIRLITGTFRRMGENGQYWSSMDDPTVSGDKAMLFNFDGTARALQRYAYSKNLGASCRCVKE